MASSHPEAVEVRYLDIDVGSKDLLIPTIGENQQLVIPGPVTSSSSLNERGRRQSSTFSH